MKKIILLFCIPFMICGCGEKQEEVKVQNITCSEKEELMDDGAVLIDVRTETEFNEGHLDDALNISVETIAMTIEDKITDKATKIIVYCRSGNRSATAANALINKGYTNVYDLGGMSNCQK